MTEIIHVRPAQGGTVRHPETGMPIPAAGAHLRLNTQVRRYLRRGDLELVEPAAKTKPAPAPAPEKA